jgi:6-phosphogluconolactonase (cycloisomerase 2 family)
VSVSGNLVYVLNARDGGSITGYRRYGRTLVHLDGSTRALNLAPNANPEFLQAPSQVALSPDQRALVVATKTHGTLLTFPLHDGRPSASPLVTASGAVPFALTYDHAGRLLVVDASGLVTSYRVRGNGMLAQLSQVGPTGQAAACWSVLVHGHLFVANAGSSTISSVKVQGGQLSLTDATAANTDGGPIDLAASRHGRYVYELSGATGNIDVFRVGPNGTLTPIGTTATGLGSANGMATEGIAAS